MKTGKQLYELACTKVGQRYVLGAQVPKDQADYSGAWDCAELASWVYFQMTGKLFGCYNNNAVPKNADAYTGYWGRDAEKIGKKISVDEAAATPGAFILRLAGDGMTGHIVISDGKGGTVEAHSAKTGLCKRFVTNRRWSYGILVPEIKYSTEQSVKFDLPKSEILRYEKPNIKSDEVLALQEVLFKAGFNPGVLDGIFGVKTQFAVRQFQAKEGLNVDGEVGELTNAELVKYL